MNTEPYISVVVPFYNEEGNIEELHKRTVEVCENIGKPYEIIFVNDGSTDDTLTKARHLSPLTLINLRKNFGQTAAFDAGFKEATGEIILVMDGDLQNDPADIPLLLAKMNEGFDIVSGWRHKRHDSLEKKIFSRGANFLRKILLRDKIHDSGCSLKAYKAEALKSIDFFGEMHRFIPALLEIDGWTVGEVKVSHRHRTSGVTKYNWRRGFKGFVDMVFIWFMRKYGARPLHFFGSTGVISIAGGFLILVWMILAKLLFDEALSDRIWPLMGVFFVMLGVQLFIFGFLADQIMKNHYALKGRMNYSVKKVYKL